MAPAFAEQQTVNGTGDITKMAVNNGQTALTTKVFGLGKPCGGAQYVHVHVLWGTQPEYEVDGDCIQGAWYKGLFYRSDRDGSDSKEVNCPDFKLTYNSTGHFYKVFIPRSCMGKANNRVKVRADAVEYGSTTGGEAGPTKLLGRG
jgi:hypothetical protein